MNSSRCPSWHWSVLLGIVALKSGRERITRFEVHQVGHQLDIFKLHQHSHVYTSTELINFPGRIFKIEKVINYDKKKIKKQLANNKANITTRNFPKTVAQIRKETNLKDGGNTYLFFTTNLNNKLICIFCSKILV